MLCCSKLTFLLLPTPFTNSSKLLPDLQESLHSVVDALLEWNHCGGWWRAIQNRNLSGMIRQLCPKHPTLTLDAQLFLCLGGRKGEDFTLESEIRVTLWNPVLDLREVGTDVVGDSLIVKVLLKRREAGRGGVLVSVMHHQKPKLKDPQHSLLRRR